MHLKWPLDTIFFSTLSIYNLQYAEIQFIQIYTESKFIYNGKFLTGNKLVRALQYLVRFYSGHQTRATNDAN